MSYLRLKGLCAPSAPVLMACLVTELETERKIGRGNVPPSLYHIHLNSQENRGHSGAVKAVQLVIIQNMCVCVCMCVWRLKSRLHEERGAQDTMSAWTACGHSENLAGFYFWHPCLEQPHDRLELKVHGISSRDMTCHIFYQCDMQSCFQKTTKMIKLSVIWPLHLYSFKVCLW